MADRPQLPPPNVMIPELRTPNPINTFFRELVSRDSPRWQENNPIARGTLYSDLQGSDVNTSKLFPTLYFLSETAPIGSNTVAGMTQEEFVIWNWATVPEAESSYNAEISYLGDSVTNPVFARVRTVRRDEYDAEPAIATGTPYTGLIGVEITSGGSSYKKAEAEYDCYGEDAEIRFIISNGAIIAGIVLRSGTGFNLGSVINIIGDGSGAECSPIIQPAEAVLTSQKKVEFPDDDPRSNEFVKVIDVYEWLPGPWVPFTRYDDDLGPVQGRRRAVLNTGQQGGVITPITKRNYEGRDGSSVVLLEIEENWSNGTGTPGNPAYPIFYWDIYVDERGPVQRTSQIVVRTGSEVATFVRSGGGANITVTKTWFEPYSDNPYLLKKFVETWTEVLIHDRRIISEHGGGETAITERTAEPGSQDVQGGLLVVSDELRTKSPNEQTRRTERLSGASAWPANIGRHTDEKTGIVVNYTKQVIDAGTPYPGTTAQSDDCSLMKIQGPFVEDQPYDRWKTIRIISAVDLNTLPKKQCWPILFPVNFPPQLLSIEAIWTDFQGRTTSASAPDGVSTVLVSVRSGSNGGVAITSRDGFRGYAKGRQERTYFYGPPNAGLVPTALKIQPVSGSVVFMATSSDTQQSQNANGAISFSDQFQSQGEVHQISDHLVGAYSITSNDPSDVVAGTQLVHRSPAVGPVSATSGSQTIIMFAAGTIATMTVRIPQSTPSQLTPGAEIIMQVDVKEHPFGIWSMDVIYVTIP